MLFIFKSRTKVIKIEGMGQDWLSAHFIASDTDTTSSASSSTVTFGSLCDRQCLFLTQSRTFLELVDLRKS